MVIKVVQGQSGPRVTVDPGSQWTQGHSGQDHFDCLQSDCQIGDITTLLLDSPLSRLDFSPVIPGAVFLEGEREARLGPAETVAPGET